MPTLEPVVDPAALTVSQSQVTGLSAALDAKLDDSSLNAANGVAGLDADAKLQSSQFPDTFLLQFRSGTQAELDVTVLDEGEPGWTTDTHKLVIGDGATAGGIEVVRDYHPNTQYVGYDPDGNGGLGAGNGVALSGTGLSAVGEDARRDLVVTVKGTGSFQLRNSATRGYTLGTGTIDLSLSDYNWGQVANDSVAIGNGAQIRASKQVVIGAGAIADVYVIAPPPGVVCIGAEANSLSSTYAAVCIGYRATAADGVAIGDRAFAANGVAVGTLARTKGTQGVTVGYLSLAMGSTTATRVAYTQDAETGNALITGEAGSDSLLGDPVVFYNTNSTIDAPTVLANIVSCTYDAGSNTTTLVTDVQPSGTTGYVAFFNNSGNASSYATVIGHNAVSVSPNGNAIGKGARSINNDTTSIAGPIITRMDTGMVAGTGGQSTQNAFRQLGGVEVYLCSTLVDFTVTGTRNITLPTKARFYPKACGVIVNKADTVSVQPTIRMGMSTSTAKHRASALTTKLTAAHRRDEIDVTTDDGENGVLRATVDVAATATALKGMFYWRGLLIEDGL